MSLIAGWGVDPDHLLDGHLELLLRDPRPLPLRQNILHLLRSVSVTQAPTYVNSSICNAIY